MYAANKIGASAELTLLVSIMSLFIIGLGIYGVFETKKLNENSQELFSDRLMPMSQLGNIRFHAFNIISVTHQTNKNQVLYQEAFVKVKQSQDSIKSNWKQYTATQLTPAEKQLVDKTGILISKLDQHIENLKAAFSQEDENMVNRILRDEIQPLSKLVLNEIAVLLQVQIQIGKTINQSSTKLHDAYSQKFWWILMIAFIITVPFLYYLIKKNESVMRSLSLNNIKLFLTEKNYRKLIEYAGEAIVILNEDAEIIDLNDYAVSLLGYSRKELLQMSITDFLIPSETKGQLSDLDLVRKNNYAALNTKIRKKDGSIIETEISNRFMDGRGFFAIIRDVTERKKFEDELLRYNAELKKANAEIDRFVYSASHDLRAPLKSILGLICITGKEIESATPSQPEIMNRLDMMKKSTLKLDGFIDEILNYFKNARMAPESNEIDFEDLISETIDSNKFNGIGKIGFNLAVKSDEKFKTDKNRLAIIMKNLIANAYDYSDSSKNDPFVQVEFTADRNKAIILVKDNGIGIAEAEKDKVFDMFYRSSSKSNGSGLGLYIVREAIEKLNGSYSIESELGTGTEIRIKIPNA